MKYIISAIGKTKNQHEDLITDKYLKRIKNIQIKQYEVKFNNEQKKIEEEGLKLIIPVASSAELLLIKSVELFCAAVPNTKLVLAAAMSDKSLKLLDFCKESFALLNLCQSVIVDPSF